MCLKLKIVTFDPLEVPFYLKEPIAIIIGTSFFLKKGINRVIGAS